MGADSAAWVCGPGRTAMSRWLKSQHATVKSGRRLTDARSPGISVPSVYPLAGKVVGESGVCAGHGWQRSRRPQTTQPTDEDRSREGTRSGRRSPTRAAIGLFILPRAWRLARKTLRGLLQAAPEDFDREKVTNHLLAIPGVADVQVRSHLRNQVVRGSSESQWAREDSNPHRPDTRTTNHPPTGRCPIE